ncbi:hypothetical protein N9X40_01585 [bacterium]|nr:hypothetical protein [bacterium]
MKKILLTLSSIFVVGSLSATFQKIDDFESGLSDSITIIQEEGNFATSPSATIVADPFGGDQGNVLAINPGVPSTTDALNQTIEYALAEGQQITDPVTESKPVTFYFRMARPTVEGVPGEADITWGLSDSTARSEPTAPLGYGTYSVLGRIETNGIPDIRDGGDYIDLTTEAIETQTWYEFWFVVDHFTNTFSQYVKGGTDFPAQTMVYENAAYRNATVNPLDTLLFITSAGTIDEVKGKDDTYIDDIYIDLDGINLDSPSAGNPEDWTEIVNLDGGTDLPAGFTVIQEEGNFATSPSTTVVTDPFGDGNNALAINPGVPSTTDALNQTIEFAIPEALQVTDPITESMPVTFYFQLARPTVEGVPGEADITWGLSDSTARSEPTAPLGYGTYSVLGRIETNGIPDIRDGGDYIDLTTEAIETQAWYEMWFVVDHFTNTFTQYIKGGSDFPTQTMVYTDAAYRNATVNNLDTMLFITSAGTIDEVKGKDDTFLRNFNMSPGVNLSSPPPPAAAPWQEIVDLDSGTDLPAGFTVIQEEGNFATSPSTTVVADPFGSGGNALAINPGVPSTTDALNQTIEFAIPEALQVTDPITESAPVTFYFQVARPTVEGVPGEADITWGLSDSTARSEPTAPLGYGTYSVLGRIETNGIPDIRDGGDYIDLTTEAIETQTWYEMWFVVDHFTNTFTQYVKGGTDFPTQTMVYQDAAYRNATVNNLDTMLFITSAGTIDEVKGKDDTYLRSFNMALGVNLTSPAPVEVDPVAEWEKVVDLDSGTDLPVGFTVIQEEGNFATTPSTTVVADPFGSGGNALAINPGVPSTTDALNQTIEFTIPEALQVVDPITESDPVTFYFQLARPTVSGVPGEADITWGLSDSTARSEPTAPLGYGTYSVLGRIETNGIPDIRDGGDYIDLTTGAIDTQTWYEIWFVIDHFTNTFTQYIKGGSDFPTQTMVYEDAAYRNATVNNLDTMLFITSAGTIDEVKGKDDTYLREFYMAQGVNLSSPGDPIVDTTPRAEAAPAGSATITMTMDPGPEVTVGKLIFLNDGTELGKIASIAGRVLTLEAPSAAAVSANDQLTFVEDNTPEITLGQLVNLSTRSQVGTGDDVLIGGFVVGNATQEVLIQAVGPELANSGVAGPLLDPLLTVTNTTGGVNTVIMTNDNWQDSQGQLITDLWGGAPPLADQSLSAAAVVTLEPGTYTATISGVGDTTGVALIEVYELD